MNGIILRKQQMQEMDRRTIQELGVPSQVLMEAAGAKCAEIIKTRYLHSIHGKVLVLCGSGNNGGDGFVIARHLHNHCPDLVIALVGEGKMSPETQQNMTLCTALNIPLIRIAHATDVAVLGNLNDVCLLIDAVYGIGFRGELPETMNAVLSAFKERSFPVVAIDIASGIEADTGMGKALRADATLAIEYPKPGHLLENGRKYTGELITVPIGIPREFLPETRARLIDYSNVQYPTRFVDAHKGSYGKVFILGGSEGYLGSVNLAAHAALRSGAGLVYLCSRKSLQPYYSANPGEIMFRPIAED
ncbi:MAG TPA: NAD(P)H-hydrate epimerase, partial [Candidatus Cloacimonadota bacterium]|nr:NAD(P)H-hydrate epimerase [Candidatus Cloacimonadota bacterium]